jgi:aconitate hydratase
MSVKINQCPSYFGRDDSRNRNRVKIDQVLLQDATGTLVMLLEAFNLKKAKPEIAVQYVDH